MSLGKEKIFLDTSGFFALLAKGDKNNSKALSIWAELQAKNKYDLYTTDYVVSETLTLIQKKTNKDIALKFGESLMNSDILNITRVTTKTWDESWKIFKKYIDKKFSFVDCISFVIMKTDGIKKTFTFDRHFQQMGFELVK